jgi:hypothetical protein
MNVTFVETAGFTEMVNEYFGGDEAYRVFQQFLASNLNRGSVMKDCGGLRKIRWPDPRRGKGKRGGLRVIYLYVPEADNVLFVDVYDKDEAEDLTLAQKEELAGLAQAYRTSILKSNQGNRR